MYSVNNMSSDKKDVEKLLVDNPKDFRFHTAYLAYSLAWDNNYLEQTRLELNKIVTDLPYSQLARKNLALTTNRSKKVCANK